MKRILSMIVGICVMGVGVTAMAQHEHTGPGTHKSTEQAADTKPATPAGVYTLDTCPVSGEKLGGMGETVVKVYDGREVRFCCAMCVPKFEADKDKYFPEIDKKLIAQQLPIYPLHACPVSGEALTEAGEDIGVNVVYENRLIRFCCNRCVKTFEAHPQAYIEKLDKAVIEQQGEHYPLEVCVVSGERLGHEGAAVDRVYAGRLVRFCCKDCIAAFEKDPATYLAKVDAAWAAKHAQGKH